MSCQKDLCALLEEAIEMLEEARSDASKCQHKCNKSAGVRLRKTCQDVELSLAMFVQRFRNLKIDHVLRAKRNK